MAKGDNSKRKRKNKKNGGKISPLEVKDNFVEFTTGKWEEVHIWPKVLQHVQNIFILIYFE